MDLTHLLALGLGIGLSLGVGIILRLRSRARQRAIAGATAALARLWSERLPVRSAADIIAGRVRVVLGGEMFTIPVLPRGASRRWLESLDARFAFLAEALDEAGDDTPQILALLASHTDALYEMLRSYDQSDVLPSVEDIDERATDTEILRAVVEVWRAANPLAAIAADGIPTSGMSPEPPSSPPPPTAGTLTSSSESPTSSSSPSLTPPRTGPRASSASRSKPSAPGRSSPTTPRHTGSGSAAGPTADPASRAPHSRRPSLASRPSSPATSNG